MSSTAEVKDVSEIASETLDVIEETIDLLESKASWIASNPKVLIATAATVGVLSGALACFLVVNSRLEKKYQTIADEQVESVKSRYSLLRKEGDAADPAKLAESLLVSEAEDAAEPTAEIIIEKQNYASKAVSRPLEEAKPASVVVQNVFAEAQSTDELKLDTDWDWEIEKANRTETSPYVITKEEFFENEPEHEQTSFTYFAGDDILVDERDQPLSNNEVIDGREGKNLERFGHGSGDKNVVYVRNEKIAMDFEVNYTPAKFTETVLGVIEHSHSNDRRAKPRKFRTYDE